MTVSDVSSAKPIQTAEMSKAPPPAITSAKGDHEGDGKGSPHSAGLMNIKA